MGVQLAIVVGGGNFIRGATFAEDGHIPRATADYMGMLATVLNALALQETMEKFGQPTRVLSAISVHSVAEPFIRRRAIRHLEKGRAVILAAGTGNPFFTTDTCAALRATEIEADVLLKATKVDGIYSADPKKDTDAKLYHDITYEQVHRDELRVMDLTAITLLQGAEAPAGRVQPEDAGQHRPRPARRDGRDEDQSVRKLSEVGCELVRIADADARIGSRPATGNFRILTRSDLRGTPCPLDDILLDCEEHMEKAIEHLKHELRGDPHRAGERRRWSRT